VTIRYVVRHGHPLTLTLSQAETWSGPNDQQRAKGADGIDSYHGSNGPVQVTFPDDMFGGPQQGYFVQSIQSLTGIAKSRDLNGGDPNCVSFTPNSINWHDQDHRSTSASAYLTPVEGIRTNWLTVVNHQVTRLLWSTDGTNTATGVEFKQADNTGQEYQVYARKEVILAAGAINTPAVLQRSGVGDPAILNPLGIATVIDLPTVGKNLQEQTMNSLGANSNGFDWGGRGPSDVIAYPNLYQVFGADGQATAQRILSNVGTWADSQKGSGLSKEALQTIFGIQADLIVNNNGTSRSAPSASVSVSLARELTDPVQTQQHPSSNCSTTPDTQTHSASTSGRSSPSAAERSRSPPRTHSPNRR
jgi:choline dehydrogenase-like flavoprotein